MRRRNFFQQAGIIAGGVFLYPPLAHQAHGHIPSNYLAWTNQQDPFESLKNEDFSDPTNETAWGKLRELFPRPADYINLEHGYFSHTTFPILERHEELGRHIQNTTSVFMRREQEAAIESGRESLADFFGWNPEQLALTRNTTESLNAVISGFPWKKGDEVVIGDQDYGSMTEAFEQAVERFGIKIRIAKIPVHPNKPEDLVNAYLKELGPKTRMIHITHLINLSGQIIPLDAVIEACKSARPNGCVVVDAAHSVAQIDYNWKNCNADIVAGSLHKWMCNPLGLGFLYMKPEWIEQIWPLMADRNLAKTNIRRFEHQGTRPIQTIQSLPSAIALNGVMGGILNKEKRLRYLKELWTNEVHHHRLYSIQTPHLPGSYCAIATINKIGVPPMEVANWLWEQHKIFTVAIDHPVIKGVRITPHLSSTPEDLKALVYALQES